jgi:hypothetical protein
MKSLMKMAVATASLMGAAVLASAPANAQVHIGIGVPGVHVGVGIGGPAPAYYYGPGYYPPGPCDGYNYYYNGDCGYSVYNGPIVLGGIAVGGPHYYRWFNGRPMFWYRGGWQTWNDWDRARFAWNHDEGFGWRGGHYDRGWGDAHWHGARADFRGGPGPRGGDFRGGRDEHHDDHGDRGDRGDRGDHH